MNEREKPRSRIPPIALIIVTIFIDITGYGIVIPLLPFYTVSLQAGSIALGALLAIFSVMQFIFAPIMGRASDRFGRKPILLLSILFSMTSFIIFALANSLALLLLSRIFAGIASETAVAQAYIADITVDKDRTKGIGRISAAYGAGFITGPAISGILSAYGFSVPGFAAAIITFLNFLFVLVFLPEPVHKAIQVPEQKTVQSKGYVNRFMRGFSRPLIGSALLISSLSTISFGFIPVVLPLLAIEYYGFTSVEMSYVFVYLGAVQIVLQGLILGKLTAKLGEEKLMILGPLLMSFGMILVPVVRNIGVFAASIPFVATGSGIMQTVIPGFISKKSDKDEQGEMLGLAQSVNSIAFVPGPIIGGIIFQLAGSAVPFYLSAGMLVVAFGLGCRVFQECRL